MGNSWSLVFEADGNQCKGWQAICQINLEPWCPGKEKRKPMEWMAETINFHISIDLSHKINLHRWYYSNNMRTNPDANLAQENIWMP